MSISRVSIVVSGIAVLILAMGAAGALAKQAPSPATVPRAVVSSGISYQGRLTNPAGVPLDGTYPMRFVVYDAPGGGTALWDSGPLSVAVTNGLFNAQLAIDQLSLDGQALWLSITVDGQTLSPRQEILPAPYALSLRPGADIVGQSIGATDAVLAGYAPATGTALWADASGGAGIFGDSENNYGVWGSSNSGWGGYFTSDDGYGLRVQTGGTDHYDHGAYVTSARGYGVYAQSAQNQGLRGEAGDVTGFSQPLGPVGVVGIGSNRGVYGSSGNGSGVYGISDSNYGLWAQSQTYRGATGRTSRSDNNYGFYTPDNLFSLNINVAGAVMQVMRNGGSEPLAPGDVVAFSGIDRSVAAVDSPIVQVRRATVANSPAVAGVVFSRFNLDAIDPRLEAADGATLERMAAIEVTPAGDASPGEYVLVVVQGPAQVRASALDGGAIQPGDLLSSGSQAGSAGKSAMMTIDGAVTAAPGTVFAKALESLQEGQAMIYVYVTLQ